MHFQTWQDKAGNAPPLTDPTTGLTFPDLNADGELLQTNLIMPEPTVFIDRKFPLCSIIRPTETDGAAMGALRALTANGLFRGQSTEFFTVMTDLARAAAPARTGAYLTSRRPARPPKRPSAQGRFKPRLRHAHARRAPRA